MCVYLYIGIPDSAYRKNDIFWGTPTPSHFPRGKSPYHFFEKITQFLRVRDAFSIKKFSSFFRGGDGSEWLKSDFS